jgi:hypothetical protein
MNNTQRERETKRSGQIRSVQTRHLVWSGAACDNPDYI